jgi:hypothetical protein
MSDSGQRRAARAPTLVSALPEGTTMAFRITGLDPTPFQPLFGLADEALARRGIVRVTSDSVPGFPDRIELRDAAPGETLLLLNHVHHDVANPYRASHAIYVREGASEPYDEIDTVPRCMRLRLLSVRAFDASGMMVDADVVDGGVLQGVIERLLAKPEVETLHAHYAKRGCYAARIVRA